MGKDRRKLKLKKRGKKVSMIGKTGTEMYQFYITKILLLLYIFVINI